MKVNYTPNRVLGQEPPQLGQVEARAQQLHPRVIVTDIAVLAGEAERRILLDRSCLLKEPNGFRVILSTPKD